MAAKNALFGLIVFFVFAFAFSTFATVQLGEPAFKLSVVNYALNEPLEGYVNIGLTSESASSLIEAAIYKGTQEHEYKGMTLLDFLRSGGASFSCEPSDCGYSTVGGLIESKELSAGENFIAVNIVTTPGQGSTTIEDTLRFNIAGTSSIGYPPSSDFPYSPVAVDLLDDGSVDWLYMEAGEFPDTLEPGDCYSESKYDSASGADAVIGANMYCEMKTLLPSKSFMLGVDVKLTEGSPAPGDLSLYLSDSEYINHASCDLQQISTTEYGLYRCPVNFTLMRPAKLFVCVLNNVAGLTSYYVKMETAEELCGFAGEPESGKSFVADYALYAKPSNFAPFDYSVKLDKSSLQIEDLDDYLNDYMERKFGGDCSREGGCVIPIKVISSEAITISALQLQYTVVGGSTVSKNNFYVAEPSTITMSQATVDLKGLDLNAPSEYDDYTLELKINGDVIGSEDFFVRSIPVISSVKPRNVSVGASIKFTIDAYSPKGNEIVSYTWNFGDGTSHLITTANNGSHTYESSGTYSLIIKVKDSEGLEAQETFTIMAGALGTKETLNAALGAKKTSLSSIQSEIERMPWYSTVVDETLGIRDIGLIIDRIEEDFNAGVEENETDEYFTSLESELNQQKIPLSIKDILAFEGIKALIDVDKINPDYIKALGETYDVSQKEEIKNAIGLWQSENLDVILGGKTLSASYDDGSSEDIVTVLDIKLSPKAEELKNVYFVVVLPSGVSYSEVEFADDYGQESVNAAIGFMFKKIVSAGETIGMALPGKHDALTISMFASARFDELTLVEPPPVTCGNGKCDKDEGENYKNCPEDCKPTTRAIIYILLVMLFGAGGMFLIWRFYIAIYDLMQQKKFFKTKKNYTDLLIFISSSLNRGVSEKEIIDKLSKSGWNDEQIGYALLKSTKARQKLKKKEEEG